MVYMARYLSVYVCALMCIGSAYASDQGPGAGPWQHESPERHGFDAALLKSVGDQVGEIAGRQGFVVVHDGVIIYEDYWSNRYHQPTPAWRNTSFSAAKSWGSALVGVAVTKGLINLDTLIDPLYSSDQSGLHPDVRLQHMLTMTTGGTLVIKPSSRRPTLKTENPAPGVGIDYVRVIKPEVGTPEGYGTTLEPGNVFFYDGEPVDHLANVVAAVSGESAREFSERFLLEPLGVENFRYQAEAVDSQGNMRIAGSIELSVRDLARLGQLWLNGGRWGGEQLIDPAFVEASVQPSALNSNYGYLWWLNTGEGRIANAPETMYYAAGAFAQLVFVLPESNLVIATMGFQPELDRLAPQKIWDAVGPLVNP